MFAPVSRFRLFGLLAALALVASSTLPASVLASTPPTVSRLTVDARSDQPLLGIDDTAPTLGWQIQGSHVLQAA